MIHVVILHDQYLQAILDGRKTIEMRLTITNRVPYESVEVSERLYFKRSGGPFRGTGVVDHVMFMSDLTPRDISHIRRDYNDWIGGPPEFWASRRAARFCTLIWVRDVEPIRFGPRMKPHHGVAWQCLPESADVYPRCMTGDPSLFDAGEPTGRPMLVTLTDANIRHGHIYLREIIDRFPADALGGTTRADAGRPVRLYFTGGRTIDTDIVASKKIFRTRVWRSWFGEQGAQAGDEICLVPRGPRTFGVRLVRRPPR